MLKVIYAANQREAQGKFFTSIPIAGREDAKPLDISINMLVDRSIPVALDGDRRLFLDKMADFYERGDGTDMMRFLVDLMLRQQERYCDKLSSVSCPAVHAERDEDLDAETKISTPRRTFSPRR